MTSDGMTRITATALVEFATEILARVGLSPDDARVAGATIVESDLSGADGHGIFRLPQYVRRIRAGGINAAANIHIAAEAPASAVIDGDNGLGHLVLFRATELAIEKAQACGSAWIGIRGGNHAGAASVWAARMLPHDMIGLYLAVGSANHMAPLGGIERLLSTNPIAIAVPTQDEPPVVLDMATTVAAYGKVKMAAQRGETMPEGWMIDLEGKPLTDPKRAEEGLLVPAGGYKGYALAFLFGLLAGTLNDAAFGADVVDFNKDDITKTNTGQAVLAISLARFGDATAFKRRVDAIVRQMRNSARMPGIEAIHIPGEGRHAARQERQKSGIPIPAPLLAVLDKLAADLGVAALPR